MHQEMQMPGLIVQNALESPTTAKTVLVGDDTDLLVLLHYHGNLESFDLFCPEPKTTTKKPPESGRPT